MQILNFLPKYFHCLDVGLTHDKPVIVGGSWNKYKPSRQSLNKS